MKVIEGFDILGSNFGLINYGWIDKNKNFIITEENKNLYSLYGCSEKGDTWIMDQYYHTLQLTRNQNLEDLLKIYNKLNESNNSRR